MDVCCIMDACIMDACCSMDVSSCLLHVTSCVHVHLYRCELISVHESDCVLKIYKLCSVSSRKLSGDYVCVYVLYLIVLMLFYFFR